MRTIKARIRATRYGTYAVDWEEQDGNQWDVMYYSGPFKDAEEAEERVKDIAAAYEVNAVVIHETDAS